MAMPKINLMVQRLKDAQLAAPRGPRRGALGSTLPLSDEKRLDNYRRQNKGQHLTARQRRQIGRQGVKHTALSGA